MVASSPFSDAPAIKANIQAKMEASAASGDVEGLKQAVEEWQNSKLTEPPQLQEALATAASHGFAPATSYLLSQGARPDSTVSRAVLESKGTEIFDTLLTGGWNFKENLGHIGDPLIRSAASGKEDRVRWLLEHGADPNENWSGSFSSALDLVVMHSSVDIADLLIKHGAELNNAKLLTEAATFDKTDMLDFLLDRGASINELYEDELDGKKGNALHYAARHGKEKATTFLLSKGADRKIKNSDGKTAAQIASDEHQGGVLSILES